MTGKELKAMRKKAGLTLEEVGKALGVSKQSVSKWEKGICPIPENRVVELFSTCHDANLIDSVAKIRVTLTRNDWDYVLKFLPESEIKTKIEEAIA